MLSEIARSPFGPHAIAINLAINEPMTKRTLLAITTMGVSTSEKHEQTKQSNYILQFGRPN